MRAATRPKSGPGSTTARYSKTTVIYPETATAVLAVDEALDQLSSLDPRLTRLVELRFFVGLTLAEAADCLRISLRTANRDWARARAFIRTAVEPC